MASAANPETTTTQAKNTQAVSNTYMSNLNIPTIVLSHCLALLNINDCETVLFLPHSMTFCEALQYWIRGSGVLYTIHIYWHFMGSQVTHCAPVEEAVDSPGISLWTVTVLQYRKCVCHTWQDPAPVQPADGGGACAHNAVESQKVKRWWRCRLLTRLFCSRFVQEGRLLRRGVGCLPHCCIWKCHRGCSMLSPWKPSLHNIWFWSAQRLRWDLSGLLPVL